MDDGWIKIYRKILDNPISNRPLWCWLWVYILIKANHDDNKFIFNNENITIKRGQFISGLHKISEETHISIQIIRSGLAYLKSTNQITIKSSNKYSVITINNYNRYQEVTSKVTNQQQTSNKPATTNKNDKNEKNININNNTKVLVNSLQNSQGSKTFGNQDINEVASYFLGKMGLPTEDCAKGLSRQYWNTLLKEKGRGVEGVKMLIDLASQDEWYRNNITSSKNLYYNRVKLVSRKRGSIPHIAVMPKEVI